MSAVCGDLRSIKRKKAHGRHHGLDARNYEIDDSNLNIPANIS